MKKLILLFFAFLLMSGCSATKTIKPDEAKSVNTKITICPEPRPEFCTQQYDPVCGQLSQGGSQTYPNWCTACSDKSVESYLPGECP
jgi:hypothetical protein